MMGHTEHQKNKDESSLMLKCLVKRGLEKFSSRLKPVFRREL